MSEPKAYFKIQCPHCHASWTAHMTRSELKKYIKDIDKEAKKKLAKTKRG